MNPAITITLKNGHPALLRPVIADDKDRIAQGMRQMSPSSRYSRFFGPTTALTPEQLQYFTEIDQQNHVAWIALDATSPEHPGLGIGRFIRCPEAPEIAEAAFTVIDPWQGRGVGTYLAGILWLMARARGIQTLRAAILPENHAAIAWFRRLGARGGFDHGLEHLDLPVTPHPSSLPAITDAPALVPILRELQSKLPVCPV